MAMTEQQDKPWREGQLKDWHAYITGTCTLEESERLEKLLLEDKQALDVYLAALEQLEPALQDYSARMNTELFTDQVMAALPDIEAEPCPAMFKKRRWFEKPVFHYVIAASLTLILLSSGAFDKMMLQNNGKAISQKERVSYSDEVMRATTSWLDKLKP
jgi:anti-sigma factor RsiW